MGSAPGDGVYYKRSRFATRLPADRLYTPSHFWIVEGKPGLWRVGLTKFAARMLGDVVDLGFNVQPEDPVEVGQTIGWLEGFKALTELYSVIGGRFEGGNTDLDGDIDLVDRDRYGKGWLYAVRGTPDPAASDVRGYVAVLDATIDKMRGKVKEP
jgi:glycine cleavage system H protein